MSQALQSALFASAILPQPAGYSLRKNVPSAWLRADPGRAGAQRAADPRNRASL